MAVESTFHPKASTEYLAAIRYYWAHASATVAEAYIDEVEAAASVICRDPLLWRTVDGVGTGRYLMHRFPYAVLFAMGSIPRSLLRLSGMG